jgi:hypothetical protein
MAKILKKNYALESLPDFNRDDMAGDACAILRLNAAGRRYLIEDGSSISKGVEMLSAVPSDINCVFLHLLENPRLCDRSAMEVASDSTRVGGKRVRRIQVESERKTRRSKRAKNDSWLSSFVR